jgi:hypothetical protein
MGTRDTKKETQMSIADIILTIAYADSAALSLADTWLAQVELEDRAARLIRNADSYSESRKARKMLCTGKVAL